MKKFIGLMFLLCYYLQINAANSDDTLSFDRDGIVSSKNYSVICKNKEFTLTLELIKNSDGKTVYKKKITADGLGMISISDNGTMLFGYHWGDEMHQNEDMNAVCLSNTGRVLWKYIYPHWAVAQSARPSRAMILSPDAKYALKMYDDNFVLFSGLDGSQKSTTLTAKLQNKKYMANFDCNSDVVVFTTDWHLIKYDPEKDTILTDIKVQDPTDGKLQVIENDAPEQCVNNEKTLFTFRFSGVQSMQNGILIVDNDFANQSFQLIDGNIEDIKPIGNNVLATLSSFSNGNANLRTIICMRNVKEPIVIDKTSQKLLLDPNLKQTISGDEINFRYHREDTVYTYTISKCKLTKNMPKHFKMGENERTWVIKRR